MSSNFKSETERASDFVTALLAPSEQVVVCDIDTLTIKQLRYITVRTKSLQSSLNKGMRFLDHLLLPLCAIIATHEILPARGFLLADLCIARITYAKSLYSQAIAGMPMGERISDAARAVSGMRRTMFQLGRAFSALAENKTYPDICDEYRDIIAGILAASMIETIFLKPNFKPEDLFINTCVFSEHNVSIINKWMESCNIPVIHFK